MAYRPEYYTLEDKELIRLFQKATQDESVRDGSREREAAFTVLIERYQKRIYSAAKKMMHGDHDEADEIAQETFVKAYDALQNFRGESQLYTWLYRIMVNGVIQRSRKKKVRQFIGLDNVKELAEEGAQADEQMLKSETSKLIEQAIETLPPKQQRVFMMRFYDELPYEDIASIVGTSVGGLKANYFHAVKKIGEYLQASGKFFENVELIAENN